MLLLLATYDLPTGNEFHVANKVYTDPTPIKTYVYGAAK